MPPPRPPPPPLPHHPSHPGWLPRKNTPGAPTPTACISPLPGHHNRQSHELVAFLSSHCRPASLLLAERTLIVVDPSQELIFACVKPSVMPPARLTFGFGNIRELKPVKSLLRKKRFHWQRRVQTWHGCSCAGGVPVPVGDADNTVAAGAAAAGHGRCSAHSLLAAALPDLQADVGPAADPRAARASARRAAPAAQRRHLPVGPRHPDAPLQHPLHARHLPPHRHAPHSGTSLSQPIKLVMDY